MDRRKFINSAAASACTLAAPLIANSEILDQKTNVICRITVLKRTVNEDYIKKYKDREVGRCSAFSEGQEFTIDSPWRKPDGFCDWAWADI